MVKHTQILIHVWLKGFRKEGMMLRKVSVAAAMFRCVRAQLLILLSDHRKHKYVAHVYGQSPNTVPQTMGETACLKSNKNIQPFGKMGCKAQKTEDMSH
jgi:hypothetical protein